VDLAVVVTEAQLQVQEGLQLLVKVMLVQQGQALQITQAVVAVELVLLEQQEVLVAMVALVLQVLYQVVL
jgi:hypothetical protein